MSLSEPKDKETKQGDSKTLTAEEIMNAAAFHLEQSRQHAIRYLELISLI
jgi:hypothetical protein